MFIVRKLLKNLMNSLSGIKYALTDKSFFLECILGIFFIPLVLLHPNCNKFQKMTIFITYALLLSFELANTAIEKLCDQISLDYDEDIKAIKDMASGAVFIVVLILIGETVLIYV